ncbi:phasin family protein [Vibrio sp. SCSIO 43136]|uniref:phasin family protein n=1 Tax=Vibrio sp. SCSIO 43136 TaxID=2819101 RepID=UPI0020754579|nr:phasin family protein [Vibrio sp. SCSIO 43136]USD67576.1 phasin family protein [Vibrio sp. SCSIO 43136]
MSTQETFKAFTSQLETVTNPFYNFNQLITKNVETLSKIQLESLQAYSTLGNETLQSMAAIKQPQDLAGYGTKQMEVASKISQQLLEDSQKLSQLGQDFKVAADELAAASVQTAKSA